MIPYKKFFRNIRTKHSFKYNKIFNKLIDDLNDRDKIWKLKLTLYNE